MQNQLDPQAVNLAKAIRQTESGGNFTAKGKSGEYGAYQFTEPTWNAYSKKYGVNAKLQDATPEQQNEVAYKQIKDWKDSGMNVGQIASTWNSGKPDAYLDTNYKGTNSHGVNYDVPAYAKSVATAYQTIKNGGQVGVDPNNPSSVPQFPFQSQTDTETQPQNQEPADVTHAQGANLTSLSGIAKSTENSLIDLVPGAKTLGQSIGTLGGLAYEKLKGLFGGQDNSKNYDISDAPSVGKTALAGAETVGTAGLVSGLGAGASYLAGSGLRGALEGAAPYVETSTGIPAKAFTALDRTSQLNALGEALKGAQMGDAEYIAKAIKALQPSPGMLSSLLKVAKSAGKEYVLIKAFGGSVGGLIHNVTGK